MTSPPEQSDEILPATEEQQHSANAYLSIFDEFPAMIWRTDAAGQCDYVNKSWLAFTGRTPEQENGYGWTECIHPENREKVLSAFENAFRCRRAYDIDYQLRYHDGNYRWVASTGWPFYHPGGIFTGFFAFTRDISDRKQAVEERIAILSRASQAERLATLGTLTAGIAHEINQPLNALKITADGILFLHKKGKIRPLEDIIRDVEEISDCATQIDSIIKHLRSFIRNRRGPETAHCHLDAAVRGSLHLIGSQLAAHGIRLEKQFALHLPLVALSQVQMEQIVINLLVNAMQALDSCPITDKCILVATSTTPQSVILEISDNGPGVAAEMADKIFDPFFTTHDTENNMGLGLSIVASILNDCRGRVTVANNNQGGAVFRVELPWTNFASRDGEVSP